MAKKSKTAVSVTDSTTNQVRVTRRACNSLISRVEVMKVDLKVALGQTVRAKKDDPDSGVVIAEVLSAMKVPLTLEGAKSYLEGSKGVLGKRAKATFEFWAAKKAEKAVAAAPAKRGRPKKTAAVVTPALTVMTGRATPSQEASLRTGKPGRPKKLENMTLAELEALYNRKVAELAAAKETPEETAAKAEMMRKIAALG